ncbi:MAG TPA: 2OG-Fe(II) oxygenase [Pyrinomonadaceae bacterium]|nr:2OG-Fe(II) oxygenase [Pyrinomonadaceae bacterium]
MRDALTIDPTSHFRLFVLKDFFDQHTCEQILTEMRSGQGDPATVYGQNLSGLVNDGVRRAVRYKPSLETVELVKRKLLECKPDVERNFEVSLSDCEEPQFLRYRVGDFFVAHQDGNTGLLRLDTENRLVSVVIFLNHQSETPKDGAYCGGSLTFHDWRPIPNQEEDLSLAGETGTLVAFRSETTHEVTPVTHGERFSIACWYS